MHPGLVVFLSIFMPFFLILLLLGPVYGGAYAGIYFYYGPEVVRDALYPDYLYAAYSGLWHYFMQNIHTVSWLHFVIPAFGLLIAGFFSSILLMVLFVKYIHGIFTL